MRPGQSGLPLPLEHHHEYPNEQLPVHPMHRRPLHLRLPDSGRPDRVLPVRLPAGRALPMRPTRPGGTGRELLIRGMPGAPGFGRGTAAGHGRRKARRSPRLPAPGRGRIEPDRLDAEPPPLASEPDPLDTQPPRLAIEADPLAIEPDPLGAEPDSLGPITGSADDEIRRRACNDREAGTTGWLPGGSRAPQNGSGPPADPKSNIFRSTKGSGRGPQCIFHAAGRAPC
jgi:hypothetical protein